MKNAIGPCLTLQGGLDHRWPEQLITAAKTGKDALPNGSIPDVHGPREQYETAGYRTVERSPGHEVLALGKVCRGGKFAVVDLYHNGHQHVSVADGKTLYQMEVRDGQVARIDVRPFGRQNFVTRALARWLPAPEVKSGLEDEIVQRIHSRLEGTPVPPAMFPAVSERFTAWMQQAFPRQRFLVTARQLDKSTPTAIFSDNPRHISQTAETRRAGHSILLYGPDGRHEEVSSSRALRTSIDALEQILTVDRHGRMVSNTAIDHRYWR